MPPMPNSTGGGSPPSTAGGVLGASGGPTGGHDSWWSPFPTRPQNPDGPPPNLTPIIGNPTHHPLPPLPDTNQILLEAAGLPHDPLLTCGPMNRPDIASKQGPLNPRPGTGQRPGQILGAGVGTPITASQSPSWSQGVPNAVGHYETGGTLFVQVPPANGSGGFQPQIGLTAGVTGAPEPVMTSLTGGQGGNGGGPVHAPQAAWELQSGSATHFQPRPPNSCPGQRPPWGTYNPWGNRPPPVHPRPAGPPYVRPPAGPRPPPRPAGQGGGGSSGEVAATAFAALAAGQIVTEQVRPLVEELQQAQADNAPAPTYYSLPETTPEGYTAVWAGYIPESAIPPGFTTGTSPGGSPIIVPGVAPFAGIDAWIAANAPVPGNPCDWGISCMPDPPPRPPQQPTVTSLVPVDASGCGLPTPAVARVYTTTVSGVTNVTCSACNGFNQAWTLSFASRNRGSGVSDCGWDSNDPPGLCTPVGPYGNAELRYQNAGSYELLFKGSGGSNQATYTCAAADFNGLGSSTFTRTTPAAAAGCDNWPGSLTVSPA